MLLLTHASLPVIFDLIFLICLAGGAGLGKKSDADENKLNDENVGNAAENSMAVTATQQL